MDLNDLIGDVMKSRIGILKIPTLEWRMRIVLTGELNRLSGFNIAELLCEI